MTDRPTTRQLGREAESRAARYLGAQGYTVVARNYACRGGEIDLVCRHREVLIFVEVRARSGRHGAPEETIGMTKRRRIILAARHYLAQLGDEPACRFDVIAIEGDQLNHLRDAFAAD